MAAISVIAIVAALYYSQEHASRRAAMATVDDVDKADDAETPLKRPFRVEADRLSLDFASNEVLANSFYDRIFTIDGNIASVSDENDRLNIPARMTLRKEFLGPSVKANVSRSDAANVRPGDHVYVECDGARLDLGDVVASNCALVDSAPESTPPQL